MRVAWELQLLQKRHSALGSSGGRPVGVCTAPLAAAASSLPRGQFKIQVSSPDAVDGAECSCGAGSLLLQLWQPRAVEIGSSLRLKQQLCDSVRKGLEAKLASEASNPELSDSSHHSAKCSFLLGDGAVL